MSCCADFFSSEDTLTIRWTRSQKKHNFKIRTRPVSFNFECTCFRSRQDFVHEANAASFGRCQAQCNAKPHEFLKTKTRKLMIPTTTTTSPDEKNQSARRRQTGRATRNQELPQTEHKQCEVEFFERVFALFFCDCSSTAHVQYSRQNS